MATTIKDIARVAGVSPSTVSRILSNKQTLYSGYATETITRVKQIAEDLNYRKNRSAIELVTKTSQVLGIILSATPTNFAQEIISGIQKEASLHHMDTIIAYAGEDDDALQLQALKTISERSVKGILLLGITLSPTNEHFLRSADIPYIFLSVAQSEPDLHFIASNDFDIGYQATQYLINHGHHDIAFVGANLESCVGHLRLDGYRQALKEHHITYHDDYVIGGNWLYVDGVHAVNILQTQINLTAILAGSDLVAAGVMNRARQLNRVIPSDLSVMGIDGTQLCDVIYPQLTSIKQSFYEMGVQGTKQIIEKTHIESAYTSISIKDGASVTTH